MSVAHSYAPLVEECFAEDYSRTFVDFVRHVQRQGFPVTDRVMESAHLRATERASEQARARGFRSVNFTPLAAAGLARARARYGY